MQQYVRKVYAGRSCHSIGVASIRMVLARQHSRVEENKKQVTDEANQLPITARDKGAQSLAEVIGTRKYYERARTCWIYQSFETALIRFP